MFLRPGAGRRRRLRDQDGPAQPQIKRGRGKQSAAHLLGGRNLPQPAIGRRHTLLRGLAGEQHRHLFGRKQQPDTVQYRRTLPSHRQPASVRVRAPGHGSGRRQPGRPLPRRLPQDPGSGQIPGRKDRLPVLRRKFRRKRAAALRPRHGRRTARKPGLQACLLQANLQDPARPGHFGAHDVPEYPDNPARWLHAGNLGLGPVRIQAGRHGIFEWRDASILVRVVADRSPDNFSSFIEEGKQWDIPVPITKNGISVSSLSPGKGYVITIEFSLNSLISNIKSNPEAQHLVWEVFKHLA